MRTNVEDQPGARAGHPRRAVLRAAGGAVLAAAGAAAAGCGLLADDPPPPPPDPLDPLLAGALALADRHDAAIAAHPGLATALTPVRDAHLAHAAALTRLLGRPTASRSAPASTGAPAAADPAATLAELRGAEREGQRVAAAACLAAPADRATLLGSIAAARASHLEVLA